MLGQELEGGVVAPLFLNTHTICAPDQALANVRHAINLGLPRFALGEPKGAVSICGAGPSLADSYADIKGDVIACNSAIKWLAERGVPVTHGFLWDADPRVAQFAHRVEGCTYYVASRCDPAVFEALEGLPVVLWHAVGDAGMLEMLNDIPGERDQPCLMGGSAAVTRAIYLAYGLGYRDIHLHGADSSHTDNTHVAGSIVEEESIRVLLGNRWFNTSPWMAAQAQEFGIIYRPLNNMGATITAHGDGLLPHMWRTLKDAA